MTAPSLSSSRAHGFLSFVFFAILGLALAEPASAFTAVAGIPDDGPPYAAWNYPTQAQADREAKKGCRDTARNAGKSKAAAKKCAVLTRAKGPGFGAFVCAEAGCAWTTGYDDRQRAVDAAFEQCSKHYENCQTTGIRSWHDDAGFPVRARAESASCIPQTTRRQCEFACTNGDCVVEYTNGCRVRVQVAPRFDPLANEWKFPPPTC